MSKIYDFISKKLRKLQYLWIKLILTKLNLKTEKVYFKMLFIHLLIVSDIKPV